MFILFFVFSLTGVSVGDSRTSLISRENKNPSLFINGFFYFIRHCSGNLFIGGRAHVTITYMGAKSANKRSAIFLIYFSYLYIPL